MKRNCYAVFVVSIILVLACQSKSEKKNTSTPIISKDSIAKEDILNIHTKNLRIDSLCFPCHSMNMKYFGPPLNKYSNNQLSFIKSYLMVKNNKFHRGLNVDTSYLKDVCNFVNKNTVICDTLRSAIPQN
jgi:hypothetical protein